MERLKNVVYGALAAATVYAGSVVDACASSGSSGDPSAPLDILRQARQKAASSNLTVNSITAGGSKAGLIIMAIAALGEIGWPASPGSTSTGRRRTRTRARASAARSAAL